MQISTVTTAMTERLGLIGGTTRLGCWRKCPSGELCEVRAHCPVSGRTGHLEQRDKCAKLGGQRDQGTCRSQRGPSRCAR